MKKFIAALLGVTCSLGLACSGQVDGNGNPIDDNGDQIGQTEEAYTSDVTIGSGLRIQGVLFAGCSPLGVQAVQNTSDTCSFFVPNQNSLAFPTTVFIDSRSETTSLRADVQAAVNFLNADPKSKFRFTLQPAGQGGTIYVGTFGVNADTQFPTSSIHRYNGGSSGVGIDCNVSPQLTESPVARGGKFFPISATGCAIGIANTALAAQFSGSAFTEVRRHALKNSLLKFVGLGDTGCILSNSLVPPTCTSVDAVHSHSLLVPGQLCFLETYSSTGPGDTIWTEQTNSSQFCASYPSGM